MAAYAFVHIEVVDSEAHAEYRRRVGPMLEAYGGRIIARGDVVEVIGGEMPSGRHRMLVLEFPTVEQARGWHTLPESSPEYADLRAVRNRSGNAVLTIVDGNL